MLTKHRPERRRSRLAVAAVVAALIVIVGLASTFFRARREVLTHKRFKGAALSVLGYQSRHGALPAAYVSDSAGRPVHSWRVLVLPWLGYQDLFDQYDFSEPWDGPHNRQLIPLIPIEYQASNAPVGHTDVVAVVGSGTLWPGATRVDLTEGNYAGNV
ncbi:MAG: DUF1559 domain-containing protein, partial [Planctomycetota bacterium]